ncbi:DUF1349 domain-containing protein [Arthrobacter sp. 35W]|uniref:DUF1349 domain-containing protein n=1 Tax=Arthrobacter sp. 35W TaxID=1132441 RepID=UPI0003FF5A52|nr:DUF1349 domain-containing protein [Arthrobacter sp. 35W]
MTMMSSYRRSDITSAVMAVAVAALMATCIALPAPAHADAGPLPTPATAGYGSGTPIQADASTSAQHAAARTIVDVTAFGADPTGQADSAEAIAKAVDHARDAGGPTTIVFPRGTYQIYPEKTEKRELYVSNTTGADSAYRMKNIAILIEDMSDVVVDGQGSQFAFHGAQTQFASIRSENVSFTNFTTDWVAPATVDLTVLDAGVKDGVPFRDIQVPPGTGYQLNGSTATFVGETSPYTGNPYWTFGPNSAGNGWNQVRHLASGETVRSAAPIWNYSTGVAELGGNRLRVSYSGSTDPGGRGDVYEMRNSVRDHPAVLAFESTNTDLKNLGLGYLHGFGVVAQMSTNVTVDGVRFRSQDGTWRQTSGFADYLQMSSVAGKVQILNSLFDNPHDDPINVHGTYVQVKNVDVANKRVTLEYMHNETAGFPQFYAGNTLQFVNRATMLPAAGTSYAVTAVSGPTGYDHNTSLTQMTVTLDRAPEAIQADSFVAENLTYTPEVHIAGNSFVSVPTRGILVTTPKPVLIEKNLFDQMSMASIYVSGDARGWYESGAVQDLTIRENIFDRPATSSPVVFVEPTNTSTEAGRTVHRGIHLEDNRFNLLPGTQLLNASSVSDVTITGNHIGWYGPTTAPDPARTSSTPLYALKASARVQLSGNSYAPGFNVRVNTNGMAASEITGTDPFAVNQDAPVAAPVTPLANGLGWIRENRATWAPVALDAVRLSAGSTGLWATQNGAENILLRNAGAAAPATVVAKLSGATKSSYEEAGLVIYLNDDNYVALQRKHANGSPVLAVVTESNGSPNENTKIAAPSGTDVWLKLARQGSSFTGSYSTNGTDFTTIGTITNAAVAGAPSRAGVMADGSTTQGTSFVFSGLAVDGSAVPFFDTVPPPIQLSAALGTAAWNGVDFGNPVATRAWVATTPAGTTSVSGLLPAADPGTSVRLTLNGRALAAGPGGAVVVPLAAGANVVEARTVGANGDSQTYRWTIVSLQPGVVVNTMQPASTLNVALTAATRCVAGKVLVTVQAANNEAVPVSVVFTSAYGAKSFAGVGAGKNAVQAFTTREKSVPAGMVAVALTATVAGAPVSVQAQTPYAGTSCS